MLEHVLVTLQQRPETSFLELCAAIAATLEEAYRRIRRARSALVRARGTRSS